MEEKNAEKKNIFESIAKVMEDIGAVEKDSTNEQQRFKYRGIDAVMNALNPALVKNKVFIVPQVLERTREERKTAKGANMIYTVLRVKYTFYAEDGSCVEAIVPGEGMDSGDKSSNKALAAAFKYACFQVFCIPTEEMKDPDADTHEESEKIEYATDEMRRKFISECARIGKTKSSILEAIGGTTLAELTVEQYEVAMKGFRKTPDKTVA